MRRVVRKRIRRTEPGLDLAIDFNADVAINVGGASPDDDAREPAPEGDRDDDDRTAPQAGDHEGKDR